MSSLRRGVAGPLASGVSLLVISLALAGGWWAAALTPDTRPALTSALDVLPAGTTVVGFTDWKGVRDHLGLGTADSAQARDDLTNDGATRDLTTRSVIGSDIEAMNDALGWSAADADWEVYGQDPVGSANVVRLGGSVSFDDVRAKLRSAGFRQDGRLWKAAGTPPGVPSIVANVGLDSRNRLVVMSDVADGVSRVLDVVAGDTRSLAGRQAAADTARALAGSDSVILQAGALGCESTAVNDSDDARQARAAVERAGDLESYRFSGRGLEERGGSGFASQQLVLAMTFDSGVVASEQARVRERLSTGPFIGSSGRIRDTLRLRSAGSDGSTTRLAFAHDPATAVFMTGTGPLLFATCPI